MALVTGTPFGITSSQTLLVDTPPKFYFQENKTAAGVAVGLLNNPDSDSFFWNLSGTSTRPVFEGGCYDTFAFTDIRETNMVRCDGEGDRAAIQQRTSLQVSFNLKEFFKLTKLRHMLNLGAVTTTAGATEKLGIGKIDNSLFYYLYFPTVYDQATGDYIAITLFNAQFTSAWAMSFVDGNAATVNIQLNAFIDSTKPVGQEFGSFIRADPSAL